MRMDTRIPMMGQPVNAFANFAQGIQTAGVANEIGDQNRMRNVFMAQGADIMRGDQNALAALAQTSVPGGVMATNLNAQFEAQRQAARERAAALAADMSEQERVQQAEAARRGLMAALPVLQEAERTGDLTALNEMLTGYGMEPVNSVEEAYVRYMEVEGAIEGLETFRGLTEEQGPELTTANQTLVQRADMLGLEGEERDAFIRSGGRTQDQFTVHDPITGNPIFQMGGGGMQAADAGPAGEPAPVDPVEGADTAFGVGGFLRGGVNAAADAFGFNVPFPETQQAQADINAAGEVLLSQVAAGYSRQPPSWLLQQIRSLIPFAGNLRGSQGAMAQYNALRRQLETDIENARAAMRGARNNPARLAELEDRIRGGANALSLIEQIAGGIDERGEDGDFSAMGVDDLLAVDPGNLTQEQRDEYEAALDRLLRQ